MSKTFLFQVIQFSQTVLFQTIQFSISIQFSSIQPIDRTLSGATTSGQNGPGSEVNEGVLYIPQSSSITGTSPSDCLVEVLPFCRCAVSVFYSPSQLGEVLTGLDEQLVWLNQHLCDCPDCILLIAYGKQVFNSILS